MHRRGLFTLLAALIGALIPVVTRAERRRGRGHGLEVALWDDGAWDVLGDPMQPGILSGVLTLREKRGESALFIVRRPGDRTKISILQ